MKTLKNNISAIIFLLLGAGVAYSQSIGQPSVVDTGQKLAANMSRPCIYASGGWTAIDSDNSGANLSAAMTPWSTYVIQCTADAYIAWGDATAAADSDDGWLAGGAWIRFVTTNDINYVSVLNITHADADCHYIECK